MSDFNGIFSSGIAQILFVPARSHSVPQSVSENACTGRRWMICENNGNIVDPPRLHRLRICT